MIKISILNAFDNIEKEVQNNNLDKVIDYLYSMTDAIDERIATVEYQQPGSDGIIYDRWCEKYDDIVNINGSLQNIIDKIQEKYYLFYKKRGQYKKEQLINDLKTLSDDMESYQYEYGGLKKLMLTIE